MPQRIVHLTPGTGSFYCGTCLRDNALVTALRKLGHDATLLPLYLPLTLDEPDASDGQPVLMGGINVYLQQKSALFQKTPRWLDHLLDAPALLKMAASRAGMTAAEDLGDVTLSMLRGEEGRQKKEIDKLVDWLKLESQPDAVCLSNALLIGLVRRLKSELKVPVVCSLQGEDSFLDSLPEPYRTQSWETIAERARECDAFVAPSRYFGDLMQERLKLPPERVHVVYNGIALDGYEPAQPLPDPPVLGFFARQCQPKGLETLVEAFIILKQRDHIKSLKLLVAGTKTVADEPFVNNLRARLEKQGLARQALFLEPLDRNGKIAFLQNLSALSVPATYGESFGLYIIEALACGVPVAQPRHAAFPELIEITGGGVLCEPNDPQSLAEAVERLLNDPGAARAMGEHGRQVVLRDFSAEQMARNFAGVIEPLGSR
ncbi:MAG: glycosyltransferase family 4 protein [Armatimonadota bacterium]|nr:glycosyltransferase family 4 protein [Armatimonadota bacterium]